MADIVTGLGINIFGSGYTGGAGQTALIVDVSNNALKVDSSSFTQPVVGTGIAGTAATGVVTIQGIAGMTPISITGNITATSSGTQVVSGTVTVNGEVTAIPTGTQTVSVSNTVTVNGQVTAVPSGTQIVSGTVTVDGSVTAVPTGTQTVSVSNTVTVNGQVTAVPTGTQIVSGTVTVDGSVTAVPTGTQTVSVSNTVAVSGQVTAVPTGTQIVSGTVTVDGSVTAVPVGTQSVVGTNTAGTDVTTGIFTIQGVATGVSVPVNIKDYTVGTVNDFSTADVAASSSNTIVSHAVPSGSFVLKGIQSSSSAGPVKIVVKVANSTLTTTLCVGFFSSANPFVNFNFNQGYIVGSGNTVQVVGFNNALSSQTIYSSINGLTI